MPNLLAQLTPFDYLLIGITVATLLALNGPWLRRSPLWSVTITPLASIIGSGFLVVAPLLRDIAGPLAAAAMLCLGVGGVGGWQMRGMRSDTAAAPMADAIEAYRLVALDHAARPDMVAQRPGDLQRWLDTRFEHAARLPDLTGAGFHPVAGRLFATDQGPAAMVLYRDTAGHTISFYVRPPGPRNHLLPDGQRVDGGLLAQYWSGEGYNYAMVSRDDGVDPQVAAQAKRRAI